MKNKKRSDNNPSFLMADIPSSDMLVSKEYQVLMFIVFANTLSIIAIASTANPVSNGFHNKSIFINQHNDPRIKVFL